MNYRLTIKMINKETGEIAYNKSAEYDDIKKALTRINKIDKECLKDSFKFNYTIEEI